MNKGSTAMSAFLVVATGGYFAYDYYQSRQQQKKEAAARSAANRPSSGSSTSPDEGSGAGTTREDRRAGGDSGSGTGTGTEADADGDSTTTRVRKLQVPKLIGLTPEKATEKLVAAGFKPDTLEIPPEFGCAYDDERRDIVPVGTICNQDRDEGESMMSNAKLRVVVEHDTWEAGGAKFDRPWRRMPDLEGMPLDRARALLRSQGFADDEFEESEAMSSCGRNVVCAQRPKKDTRKYAVEPGELMIGQ